MNSRRTRGWYLTRIELALGIGAVVFALWAATYDPMLRHPLIEPRPFRLADLIIPAAFAGMLVGLV